MGEALELKAWPHPSMQFPFKFAPPPFKLTGKETILSLMEAVEDVFEELSEAAGAPHALQINVLWNIKDHKKALNPNDKLQMHFASGDTFGLYGDIMPAEDVKGIPEEEKLPVLILTGFLGSGKTTLLNYILKEQTEKKIAIIENEFGEVSIDDDLLKQNQKMELAEKIITMENGCVCCTIRSDLQEGLKELLKFHRESKLDAIVIETTGMADPVPIVKTFMELEELQAEMRVDGILTVADAKNLPKRLADKDLQGSKEDGAPKVVNEAFQQVAFADKIILNKLDLVTTEEAIAIKDEIRSINAFAKILPAVKGRVKLTELTNLRAHDMTNFADADIAQEAEEPQLDGHVGQAGHGGHGGDGGHGGGHGHDENCEEDHGHGGHAASAGHGEAHAAPAPAVGFGHTDISRHDKRVNSFGIVREGEIIPRKLTQWMQELGQLPEDKGVIFRIKAIMNVKNHPYKHVFHAVMDVSDEDDVGPWAEGEKRVSKIVFIGKGLDKKHLTDGFNNIFEKP
mmetsp:Transcript_75305/g.178907  ORF Transcript_75305/g.178907 Transcript_75305/m.178907 type:complete len:513 (+) Transcript_75305:66-1604(+)